MTTSAGLPWAWAELVPHSQAPPSGQSPEDGALGDHEAELRCCSCSMSPAVLTPALLPELFLADDPLLPPSPSCPHILSRRRSPLPPSRLHCVLCFALGFLGFWFLLCSFFLQLCYPKCIQNCQMQPVNSYEQQAHPFPFPLTGLPACLDHAQRGLEGWSTVALQLDRLHFSLCSPVHELCDLGRVI